MPDDLDYRAATMCGLGTRHPLVRDWPVDIVKGRHMMLRRSAFMERVRLITDPTRADDIVISGMLAAGQRLSHICPSLYKDRLISLPERHALKSSAHHYEVRAQAALRMFMQRQSSIAPVKPKITDLP